MLSHSLRSHSIRSQPRNDLLAEENLRCHSDGSQIRCSIESDDEPDDRIARDLHSLAGTHLRQRVCGIETILKHLGGDAPPRMLCGIIVVAARLLKTQRTIESMRQKIRISPSAALEVRNRDVLQASPQRAQRP